MISLPRTKTSPLVPALGPSLCALMIFSGACANRARPASFSTPAERASAAPASHRININTASAKELESLPGIGQGLAERIIEHRLEHGPFRRAEHLMMVRGISDGRYRAVRDLIKVE